MEDKKFAEEVLSLYHALREQIKSLSNKIEYQELEIQNLKDLLKEKAEFDLENTIRNE